MKRINLNSFLRTLIPVFATFVVRFDSIALMLITLTLALSCRAEDTQVDEDAPLVSVTEVMATPEGNGALPLRTFEERRRWIIDQVTANPKDAVMDHPFIVAEACFLAGKIAEGRELARKGYLNWSAHNPLKVRATDFFRLWPAMDCYVRYQQYLDPESKAAFKKFMTGIRCYSYGYTANLSMLMWTTRLLGEQEWGVDAFVPMAPKDTTSHYKADPSIPMKARLLRMIDAQAITGGEEYASRPYGAANLGPILCLSQLAKDPELKTHALIAHEATLARYAPIWLEGAMIITSRRSYPDLFNDPMGLATWFWTFFGGSLRPDAGTHALESAVMGEPVPAVIEHAATDRTKPYTVLNRFQENSSGRQISWIDRTYGVFSESFHTKPGPFGQTYPFGVRWIVPGAPNYTLFWFSVPVVDEPMKGNFPGSHPHGFAVNAQTTFQHEGSLLYVVNTAAEKKSRYDYGLAFVPGGALAVIDESAANGRVFLNYPGVLIAFTATKPFSWDRTARIKYASGTPHSGDTEFRVPGHQFAAAIEATTEAEFSGGTPMERLQKFHDTIIAKTRLQLDTGKTLTGTYTDRQGNVIRRAFDGEAEVNGQRVDFAHWPWAESLWVQQPAKTAPLSVTDGQSIRSYNFTNWTVTETKVAGSSAAKFTPTTYCEPKIPSILALDNKP